ncbi:MAG: 1-acyl-sn-glycerol-3-phosphate acyltransferase, partial [Gemmatimonadaceae bacterium]|nr:1-acyl-sn-glycerol-3-phosphate acyltransferase [Gemmatimonadaceae bacterium]
AGVKVEFRGLEHMPVGACLIAGKHQSMLDVIAPFALLPDNCFIMKKELAPLPFFGWFAVKTKMIAVDRSAHSKALKDMVRQARLRFAEGRQMLIFPEGTRAPVGAAPDYKPGIAALYRDLDCPCTPMESISARPPRTVNTGLPPGPASSTPRSTWRLVGTPGGVKAKKSALMVATAPLLAGSDASSPLVVVRPTAVAPPFMACNVVHARSTSSTYARHGARRFTMRCSRAPGATGDVSTESATDGSSRTGLNARTGAHPAIRAVTTLRTPRRGRE